MSSCQSSYFLKSSLEPQYKIDEFDPTLFEVIVH